MRKEPVEPSNVGAIDPVSSFAAELKAATAAVHDAAERSSFMTRLVDGGATVDEYARLLRQYHAVYSELETAARSMRSDPVVGPLARPELDRQPAIEADLAELAGPDWRSSLAVLPATERYVEQLREVCHVWPGGFLAHHYVRYLGDLSGGQILRRILRRHFGLAGDAGLTFYIFDEIDNGVQFKKQYRELVDAVPWDAGERARVCEEAVLAFTLNTDVFRALDQG